ncbi:hypothetical protein B0H19DRAFT_1100124 [Mycena capillaripes]|nr:hypothetical protein B0H19DRAFT_1100124 [Mycena capillaripes]
MDTASNIALLASRLRIVNSMHVVNITILLFDYCLTLNAEISLMWSSKWSLSKVLFFLTRYSPVFDVPVEIYYSTVSNLSFEYCSQLHAASSWGTLFGMGVAEAILILRTYALSGRQRSVLIFFTTAWAAGVSSSIILLAFFLQSATYGSPPSPVIPGCFLTGGTAIFAGIPFVIVLLNDTVIMMYTLWIGLKNYRNSRNPLIFILYRDGIMYYMFLCIISAVNFATLVQAPMPMAQLFNTFLRVVHSILSTRILLHVRDIEHLESQRTLTGTTVSRVVLSFAGPSVEAL